MYAGEKNWAEEGKAMVVEEMPESAAIRVTTRLLAVGANETINRSRVALSKARKRG
jgi:hypothetical protein